MEILTAKKGSLTEITIFQKLQCTYEEEAKLLIDYCVCYEKNYRKGPSTLNFKVSIKKPLNKFYVRSPSKTIYL